METWLQPANPPHTEMHSNGVVSESRKDFGTYGFDKNPGLSCQIIIHSSWEKYRSWENPGGQNSGYWIWFRGHTHTEEYEALISYLLVVLHNVTSVC